MPGLNLNSLLCPFRLAPKPFSAATKAERIALHLLRDMKKIASKRSGCSAKSRKTLSPAACPSQSRHMARKSSLPPHLFINILWGARGQTAPALNLRREFVARAAARARALRSGTISACVIKRLISGKYLFLYLVYQYLTYVLARDSTAGIAAKTALIRDFEMKKEAGRSR